MSASLVRLQAASAAATNKIAQLEADKASLTAALAAAQAQAGTPDADLDAVSAALEAATSPVVVEATPAAPAA